LSLDTRPLRILQVIRSPIGGLYRHVVDLSAALSDKGHAVGLVMDSTLFDAQTEVKLNKLTPKLALGVHKMPIPRLLGAADLTAPIKLRKLASSLEVDILHGHGAKGGFLARLARGQRKAIYTPHGGVLHFDRSRIGGRAFLLIEQALLHRTDAIVFESTFAYKTYVERIAKPGCSSAVIHNGLTQDEFKPIALAPDAADFVFVGELRTLKGIDLLIEALHTVRTPTGAPASLVIAGDGPLRPALEAMVASQGLGDSVTLVGVQPARDMLARGRCVVVPSLAESLPYIVLEAVAAGRPVIATDVGGISEIFGPAHDTLIEAGSVIAIRDALQAFLANEDAALKAAQVHRAYVRKHFSVKGMTASILKLYHAADGPD
jgi:glycosyltransferase involved in cell wall biosynthesis